VDNGTLPKSQLEEAEAKLSDAQDDAILSETLYGQMRAQDMTGEQAASMVDAAQRRLERQEKIVADRRGLLDSGIISQAEFRSYVDELESRRNVLELARNRARLLEDLQRMADVEQRFERASLAAKGAFIRYDGNGQFSLDDLPAISAQFEKRFHHPLPISAMGQTLVHQSMGLDHRNRVDVALNPDQPVEPESAQTRLESRFDALGPVIGIPQLCGNKDVFARDPSSGKSCLQRLAYLALVPVSFRTIEVSKSGFQRVSGSTYRRGRIGN
jgi:hypothetical protein